MPSNNWKKNLEYHSMSLGWSKYVYAIDKGVATRHPCVIALHAILLLCVVGAPNGVN